MKRLLSVTLCLAGLLFFCAVPVFSADVDLDGLSKRIESLEKSAGAWSFYGSARFQTFWMEQTGGTVGVIIPSTPTGGDRTLNHDLSLVSRLGVNVNRGDWGGQIELGIDDTANVLTRLMFGTYNFTKNIQLLVGQSYTPIDTFVSNQVFGDDSDQVYFQAYNHRRPMIQLSIGDFKIAAVKQHASSIVTGAPAGSKLDQTYPKFEANYTFKGSKGWVAVVGGFQTYTIAAPAKNYEITSYVGGISGKLDLGMVYFGAEAYAGQNSGSNAYGVLNSGTPFGADLTVIEGNDIKDAKVLSGNVVVGVRPSAKVSFEAGFAYQSWDSMRTGVTQKDDTWMAYVQSVINVGGGFILVPEFGYYDYMKSLYGVDQGKAWYAGLKTQINF